MTTPDALSGRLEYSGWDRRAYRALAPIQVDALLAGGEVNLVNLISGGRGWPPLEVGQEMTVHFGGRAYEIRRLEDPR